MQGCFLAIKLAHALEKDLTHQVPPYQSAVAVGSGQWQSQSILLTAAADCYWFRGREEVQVEPTGRIMPEALTL